MKEMYTEKTARGLFQKYSISDEGLRLRVLFLYPYDIPWNDIEEIKLVTRRPVVWDLWKLGVPLKYYFRVLKNDLADLFPHVKVKMVDRYGRYWREIRFCVSREFYDKMVEYWEKYQ